MQSYDLFDFSDLGYLRGSTYKLCLTKYKSNYKEKYARTIRHQEQDEFDQNPLHENEREVSKDLNIELKELNDDFNIEIGENPDYKSSSVKLSIDALIDSGHVRLQNQEFAKFANHLTYFVTQDLAKNIKSLISLSESKFINIDNSPEQIEKILIPTYVQNDFSNDLALPLLNAKQILHNLPLLHYTTQKAIDSLGYNITLPDPSDNKVILVSLDLVLGNAAAQYLPAESVMNAIFVSTASSISFAARLMASDYLKNQESSDEPIEFAQQCGLTIATHSLPTVVNYAFAKAFLPNAEMSTLDMLSSSSFGVVQCYNNYKSAYEAESSALNTVVPYIADVLALWTLKNYMTFDTSNVGSVTVSIKNAISVAATTYAAHCVSDVAMDFVPQEVKGYIDTALSYVTETANDLIDNLYDHLMDVSMV